MAAASTSAAQKARAPHVNLFDMPELMPGAQPSANPAQRLEFEQRCRKLHRDGEKEEQANAEAAQVTRVAAGAAATVEELELMFPNLDPALIRALRTEAPSAQHAIETLLALSAATGDIGSEEGQAAASPPPVPVGVEDHEKFPCLTDSQGWQVPNGKEEAAEEELGSAWRDRAKAAAGKPAPKAQPSAAAMAWGARKPREPNTKKDKDYEPPMPETDYEFRHRVGQRKAKNRLQYGRCRGKGAGKGAAAGAAASSRGAGDGSDSEASEVSGDGDDAVGQED